MTNANATACNIRVSVLKARLTPRKSLRAYIAEYSGIAWFHENFHSLRKFPFGERSSLAKRCAGIHYRPRSLVLSLVCFVLELAGGLSNFTLPSSGLKPISFTFYCDLQLRSVEKDDIKRYSGLTEKNEVQGFVWTVNTLRFMELLEKRTLRQITKTHSSQFGNSIEIFCRNKFW